MLTEQDVTELLAQRTENKNLDLKQFLNWALATAAEKATLVKDVLAMTNTPNGGKIVFGVRDRDFEPLGLTEIEFTSFDPTRFSDFVNRYADPPIECGVHKLSIRGLRIVVIVVSEFNDVPVICKADLNDVNNRQILKRGATYIRTERAASEMITTSECMRDVLDRATVKRSDHFHRMVDRVIAAQTNTKALSDLQIAHKKVLDDLERSYDIMLELLGESIDIRNKERQGHSRRITLFTIALAQLLTVPREEITVIARGAFLHDIGKTTIPDEILLKAGKLTPEEIAIMREHPLRGYEMLKKIPLLADSAEIVYAHQERYDGTGYPRGLKGDDIPLGARIFSIADTLDALTENRPYRVAQSLKAARAEIARWSGSQFDPHIVKVFLDTPDRIWEALQTELRRKPTDPA